MRSTATNSLRVSFTDNNSCSWSTASKIIPIIIAINLLTHLIGFNINNWTFKSRWRFIICFIICKLNKFAIWVNLWKDVSRKAFFCTCLIVFDSSKFNLSSIILYSIDHLIWNLVGALKIFTCFIIWISHYFSFFVSILERTFNSLRCHVTT